MIKLSNTQPSISKSIRLPFGVWESIQNLVEAGKFVDFSDAMRKLVDGGFRLMEIKEQVNDPEKAKKLIDEWNSKMNENDIFDWTKQLHDDTMKAVLQALDLEREKRFHN